MEKKFVIDWIAAYCNSCPKRECCKECQVKRMVKVFGVFA